jgi:hypothetical protein
MRFDFPLGGLVEPLFAKAPLGHDIAPVTAALTRDGIS